MRLDDTGVELLELVTAVGARVRFVRDLLSQEGADLLPAKTVLQLDLEQLVFWYNGAGLLVAAVTRSYLSTHVDLGRPGGACEDSLGDVCAYRIVLVHELASAKEDNPSRFFHSRHLPEKRTEPPQNAHHDKLDDAGLPQDGTLRRGIPGRRLSSGEDELGVRPRSYCLFHEERRNVGESLAGRHALRAVISPSSPGPARDEDCQTHIVLPKPLVQVVFVVPLAVGRVSLHDDLFHHPNLRRAAHEDGLHVARVVTELAQRSIQTQRAIAVIIHHPTSILYPRAVGIGPRLLESCYTMGTYRPKLSTITCFSLGFTAGGSVSTYRGMMAKFCGWVSIGRQATQECQTGAISTPSSLYKLVH